MTPAESMIDELGQIVFRIETNFDTLNRQKTYNATAIQCQDAIRLDIEKLKDLKRKMGIWFN
jgi:hypothetical protein